MDEEHCFERTRRTLCTALFSTQNIWAICCWWLLRWWHHHSSRGNCAQYPGLYWLLSFFWLLYVSVYAFLTLLSPWVTIVGASWIAWKSSVQETTKYVCPFYHRMTVTIVLTHSKSIIGTTTSRNATLAQQSLTHSQLLPTKKRGDHIATAQNKWAISLPKWSIPLNGMDKWRRKSFGFNWTVRQVIARTLVKTISLCWGCIPIHCTTKRGNWSDCLVNKPIGGFLSSADGYGSVSSGICEESAR